MRGPGSIPTGGNIFHCFFFLFSHSKASDSNIGIFANFVTKKLDYLGGYRIPRRRGRQHSGRGATYDFAKISENCMKLRKFLALGRRASGAPP